MKKIQDAKLIEDLKMGKNLDCNWKEKMEHLTEVEGAAVLQIRVRQRCWLLLRDGRQRRSRLGRHGVARGDGRGWWWLPQPSALWWMVAAVAGSPPRGWMRAAPSSCVPGGLGGGGELEAWTWRGESGGGVEWIGMWLRIGEGRAGEIIRWTPRRASLFGLFLRARSYEALDCARGTPENLSVTEGTDGRDFSARFRANAGDASALVTEVAQPQGENWSGVVI